MFIRSETQFYTILLDSGSDHSNQNNLDHAWKVVNHASVLRCPLEEEVSTSKVDITSSIPLQMFRPILT